MEPKLVVCFRSAGGAASSDFPDRGRALVERALALGGVHIGWDVLRVTFAFDPSDLEAVLALATSLGPDDAAAEADETAWSVGLAQGALTVTEATVSPLLANGNFRWGPPLVAASLLAGAARPGEILCAQTVPALRSGELLANGMRIAREGTLRVRGARIDRRCPFRKSAALDVACLQEPPLVAAHLPRVELTPGAIIVVRADPGGGGSRLLASLAAAAPRSLVLAPAGSGHEPFGALRRVLASRSPELARGEGISLAEASRLILEALAAPRLASSGTRAGVPALPPQGERGPSALVLDDVRSIDPASLEAAVLALSLRSDASISMIVRLDAMGALPSILATIPKAAEHEVPALSVAEAEAIAAGTTGAAALDDVARARWARLGGDRPLGVVAAIAASIASGELVRREHGFVPRVRASGRGASRAAAESILARAAGEAPGDRALLTALAVAGGEASAERLSLVLAAMGSPVDLTEAVPRLQRAQWLALTVEGAEGSGSLALPTRTHPHALYASLDAEARRRWHRAFASAIESDDGAFGRVEAAWHASQSGDGPRASAILLEVAAKTGDAGLQSTTTQLIALARRIDPACEDAALELLARALSWPAPAGVAAVDGDSASDITPVSLPPATTPSAPPFSVPMPATASIIPPQSVRPTSGPARVAAIASVPPQPRPSTPPRATAPLPPPVPDAQPEVAMTEEPDSLIEHAVIRRPESIIARAMSAQPTAALASGVGPSGMPEADGPGSQIAVRLGDLAKEALLAGDNALLEHWVGNLRDAGDDDAFTDRMGAMARLGRGDIGDALRVLRRTRSLLDANDHRVRCQTSLALGLALAVAGRPQDALLEALDALARARQIDDVDGATACLAFLSKLYSSVSRDVDAERLRRSSVGPPRARC